MFGSRDHEHLLEVLSRPSTAETHLRSEIEKDRGLKKAFAHFSKTKSMSPGEFIRHWNSLSARKRAEILSKI